MRKTADVTVVLEEGNERFEINIEDHLDALDAEPENPEITLDDGILTFSLFNESDTVEFSTELETVEIPEHADTLENTDESKTVGNFFCRFCKQMFGRRKSLRSHLSYAHNVMAEE